LRVALIVNPTAGSGSAGRVAPTIQRALERRGVEVTPCPTARPGDATRLASESRSRGFDCTVVVGGDGTLNEVCQAYLDERGRPLAGPPLGVIPSGTGGDFRKTLDLDTDLEHSVERLGLAASVADVQTLTAENFWAAFTTAHDQPLLNIREHPWLFAAARAVERLTPESREREPLASLASRLMSGMNAIIQRGQELGLIRVDLPSDLLVAWFRAIDGASDDWLLAQLTRPDAQITQDEIIYLARQTIAAIQQALTPPEQTSA